MVKITNNTKIVLNKLYVESIKIRKINITKNINAIKPLKKYKLQTSKDKQLNYIYTLIALFYQNI